MICDHEHLYARQTKTDSRAMTWVTCKAVCSRRACRPVHSKCCPLHLHRRVYTRRACRHPRSVCTHHVRVQPISRSRRRHHWRQRDAPMHRTLRSCAERRRHHCPCSRQSPPCISRCLQRRAAVVGCRRRRGTAPASPLWLRSQRRQSEIVGWAVISARSIPSRFLQSKKPHLSKASHKKGHKYSEPWRLTCPWST